MNKLVKKILVSGEIKLKTGLHIGGTNSSLNIGGPDKFVVRNPLSNEPYIPGSSLKGKLRALLELAEGTIQQNGKTWGPTQDKTTKAGHLFGTADPKGDGQQPSRLIVRDAPILSDIEEFVNTDLPYTEAKTEVNICRITAHANPRTFERVPAGARFKLDMVLNVFSEDNEEELINSLKKSLNLLEDDYLGGQGSRGYGQVEITDLQFTPKEMAEYEPKN
ncbi:type III-A CRISPR-associated RAMP protein Csm3 [Thermophagus xiamenensis]|jgi:CRISPR-associated protein Csm3|uniref:CRISPR system Cms endoribonuclease Csm3 n=1 Tax=Thermophagus xiamenensis TaxID=385682 RepID=A0A1I1VD01_9BACT|nr:type III-A CRISPR-associated RAMP protein Csm3 [Thermophagus xiamenensis]SFD80826.1 CRISPR-associated protein, Csm3 family [Thermophagus xiamenensis]